MIQQHGPDESQAGANRSYSPGDRQELILIDVLLPVGLVWPNDESSEQYRQYVHQENCKELFCVQIFEDAPKFDWLIFVLLCWFVLPSILFRLILNEGNWNQHDAKPVERQTPHQQRNILRYFLIERNKFKIFWSHLILFLNIRVDRIRIYKVRGDKSKNQSPKPESSYNQSWNDSYPLREIHPSDIKRHWVSKTCRYSIWDTEHKNEPREAFRETRKECSKDTDCAPNQNLYPWVEIVLSQERPHYYRRHRDRLDHGQQNLNTSGGSAVEALDIRRYIWANELRTKVHHPNSPSQHCRYALLIITVFQIKTCSPFHFKLGIQVFLTCLLIRLDVNLNLIFYRRKTFKFISFLFILLGLKVCVDLFIHFEYI